MKFGRVIGRVVHSRQDIGLKGGRFLVVSPMGRRELVKGFADEATTISGSPSIVVYDNLGAGVGDVIGYVEGAEATAPFTHPIPIDAYNAAIFDRMHYQPPK
jgi:microcompartment protein CcmK/EutM